MDNLTLIFINSGIFIILLAVGIWLYGYYHSAKILLRLIEKTKTGYMKLRYKDGKIIDINNGMAEILEQKLPRKDFIGRKLKEFFVKAEDQAGIKEALKQNDGKLLNSIYHFRTLGGSEKWIRHNSQVFRDHYTGQLVVQSLVEDITEEELSYQRMVETEERYEKLFKNSGYMVILYGFESKAIEEINPVTEIITGYSDNELLGSSFESIIHPSCRDELHKKEEELLFRDVTRLEASVVCKDGTYKESWVTLSTFDIKGKKIIMADIKDISELAKEREEQKKRRDELENFRKASLAREERIKDLREELQKAKRQIDMLKEGKTGGFRTDEEEGPF